MKKSILFMFALAAVLAGCDKSEKFCNHHPIPGQILTQNACITGCNRTGHICSQN